MKVYIIEDSPIMIERIETMISSIEGVEIAGTAGEESKALKDISRCGPDLLILDIRLKEGDGIDLLGRVKSERPGIKVAVLTNYSSPEFRDRCLELGADYFFDKSRDFERIGEVCSLL